MSATFTAGDRVHITSREDSRHHRAPAYVKGHSGIVERVCLPQVQPELAAYHDPGEPQQTVYRVRLKQTDLWPGYSGDVDDTLEIEVFEHWLENA